MTTPIPDPAPTSPPPAGGSQPHGIPERRYAGPPRAAASVTGPSAWQRWVASWRVALRLGRRDVVRHKGRSALVVIMVALPVALLVAGNLLFSTQDINAVEKLTYSLGTAQARLTHEEGKVTPTPVEDYAFYGGEPKPATPIPGWGSDVAVQAKALEQLTGAKVVPIATTSLETRIGKRLTFLTALGIDAAAHPSLVSGMARLESGRWAATSSEVVVTRAGIGVGLPESGSFDVTVTDTEGKRTTKTLTIVGIGEGYLTDYSVRPAEVVMLPDFSQAMVSYGPTGSATFLLDRTAPVGWDEVVKWADYGLRVTSRAVVLNPPDLATLDLPPGVADRAYERSFGQLLVAAISSIALLLETTLLVGPAFAVSAARSRRTLALAASNGATAGQLRRTVLGQAVVLGVLSALVGATVGFGAGVAAIAWSRRYSPQTMFGPLDVPVGPIALVVGCAVLAALIAALVPARGLARLDIVGVMRGQSVSPPARFRMPVAGLVMAGLGAVGVFWATAQTPAWDDRLMTALVPIVAMLSAVLLVVGTLLLVPMILVGVGQLARSAPVALRMALRDAARQRGRATSTVAAILAGMAVLAAVLVTMESVAVFQGKNYVPQRPEGQGLVNPYTEMNPTVVTSPAQTTDPTAASVAKILAIVPKVDPALVTTPVRVVDVMNVLEAKGGPPEGDFLVALRQGCTPLEVFTAGPFAPDGTLNPKHCASINGSDWLGADRSSIVVGEPEELAARYGLDAAATAMLRSGGLVASDAKGSEPRCQPAEGGPSSGMECTGNPSAQVDIIGGVVTFARGRISMDGPKLIGTPTTKTIPALAVPDKLLNPGGTRNMGSYNGINGIGALITPATAAALDARTRATAVELTDPRGAISPETEDRLREAIDDEQIGHVYVERGFQAYPWILVAVLIGTVGLIILVATLVSTALSTAETQAFMGTFAAVGATRGTRRNLAAAQAASLGVIGALLGTLVGMVPGIALARVSTAYAFGYSGTDLDGGRLDPTVVIPWLQLAIPVLGIPAVAAALAWLSIRRAPQVTRRLT